MSWILNRFLGSSSIHLLMAAALVADSHPFFGGTILVPRTRALSDAGSVVHQKRRVRSAVRVA